MQSGTFVHAERQYNFKETVQCTREKHVLAQHGMFSLHLNKARNHFYVFDTCIPDKNICFKPVSASWEVTIEVNIKTFAEPQFTGRVI